VLWKSFLACIVVDVTSFQLPRLTVSVIDRRQHADAALTGNLRSVLVQASSAILCANTLLPFLYLSKAVVEPQNKAISPVDLIAFELLDPLEP